MDKKQIDKCIGYAVIAISAYFLLQFLVQYLFYGVIGLVVWRAYLENNKPKK